MPKVGTKHFSYTSKGKKAAKLYAKKTGEKMMMSKKQMNKDMKNHFSKSKRK